MSRQARCIETLEQSEELCTAADLLSWTCLETQSAIALELAAWHELIDDITALESRLQEFTSVLEARAAKTEAA